jgi:hypothetical protein
MAPLIDYSFLNVRSPLESITALHNGNSLSARDLSHPNHTQAVTLGVIAAYAVGIAILWNVPYLRMILWPFKVHL